MTKKTFHELITENKPLLLPVAHDVLTGKMIEQAGFPAYQIGGFALSATQFGVPDIGIVNFGEELPIISNIIRGNNLPVLVDCDSGGIGTKCISRIVENYEKLGVDGIFFEDQKPPKKCGHMTNKHVVPQKEYIAKLKTALKTRQSPDFFIMARTDSFATGGLKEVEKRGKAYLNAGANAIFIDGLKTRNDIENVGKLFDDDTILATTVLEGNNEEILTAQEMYELNFNMILYPTSILFRVVQVIKSTLNCLKYQKISSYEWPGLMAMDEFEKVLNIDYWKDLEKFEK